MKIGIDLDEVVMELIKPFLDFYNKKYKKNHSFEDWISYDFLRDIGEISESSDVFTEFFTTDFYSNAKLIEGAEQAIKEIGKNHDIFFITSRSKKISKQTEEHLKEFFPELSFTLIHSGDVFGEAKTKAEICNDLGICFYLEDNPDFCLNCAENNINVFVFDRPWNKNIKDHQNITRVFSWEDILGKIKEVENVR
jgi:uncharacterized HAD superfamily protein